MLKIYLEFDTSDELYDLQEMYPRDEMERRTELIEAIDENTKKVSKQKQLEIAKKMLNGKLGINFISEVTGLSKKKSKNYKDESNDSSF